MVLTDIFILLCSVDDFTYVVNIFKLLVARQFSGASKICNKCNYVVQSFR